MARDYYSNWFGKIGMTHYGSCPFGRMTWMHTYVDVVVGIVPMRNENPDGSIDVLGVSVERFGGMSFGSYNKDGQQRSLKAHAEKLVAAGATIVKQTKNELVMRHGNETAHFVISTLKQDTFFKRLPR